MITQDAHGYRVPYRVRYPIELHPPPGFKAEDAATWPKVDGRLEFVGGRLLYMPPCGDVQQDVTVDVIYLLRGWSRQHPEFVVAGNEAGMTLDGETRGADAAVWRKADVGPRLGGYRRVAPVLAVEVTGQDESVDDLRAKARWYLDHGTTVVWIVDPATREVVVLDARGETRYAMGQRLPDRSELPALAPEVREFFAQLE